MQVVGVSYFRIKPKTNAMYKIEEEIKVTRFVAFDGAKFDTEAECQHYEGSAFGQLIEQLKDCTLSVKVDSNGKRSYCLVPRTRHDIYVIGQILQMAGKDTACAECYGHLTQLDVTLNCNTVADVNITDLEDYISKRSNGQYIVVSTIKKEEVKC